MERKFYTNDFERLLKQKSDEFRMYPSKRVWHSIYNNLHPSRKWPSIAMSMLLVLSLMLIGHFNTTDNFSTTADINELEINKTAGSTLFSSFTNSFTTNNKQPENTVTTSDNSYSSPVVNQVSSFVNSNLILAISPDAKLAITDIAKVPTPIKSSISAWSIPVDNDKNVIEEMDSYINSNKLVKDVIKIQNTTKKIMPVLQPDEKSTVTTLVTADNNTKLVSQKSTAGIPLVNLTATETKKVADLKETTAKKIGLSLTDNKNATDEKSWIEDYALHNKTARKKWKDRVSFELYVTPSIGYRRLENNEKAEATVTSLTANPVPASSLNKSINQKPGVGLEAGIGMSYSFAKKFRLKAGVQVNYTNYNINADEMNHPVLTTLLLNDINTNYSYLSSRTSVHANSSGLHPVVLHNKTYQLSIPIGLAVKIAGNKKLEWFAGVSIQPTYVFGGKANLISSDYQNYVSEPSMIGNWNLNTGVETYLSYKMGNYSLQVGPQLRYQVLSTYSKKYTIKENLYNAGLKVGIVKGF